MQLQQQQQQHSNNNSTATTATRRDALSRFVQRQTKCFGINIDQKLTRYLSRLTTVCLCVVYSVCVSVVCVRVCVCVRHIRVKRQALSKVDKGSDE